jgi:HK97 gp10 family phage protein
MTTVTYRSNRGRVNAAMLMAAAATVDAGLQKVSDAARANVMSMDAYATGALHDSIRVSRTGPDAGEVVADVPYAAAVHDGTQHIAPRPFLQQAASDVAGGLVGDAATEYRRAL